MTPDEFVDVLDAWTSSGGSFPSDKFDRHYLTTAAEAHAVGRALACKDLLATCGPLHTPNLFDVAKLVQSTFSKDVDEVFRAEAAPLLRQIISDGLKESVSPTGASDRDTMAASKRIRTYLFALKVVAFYDHPQNLQLIIAAARNPDTSEDYLWSQIFDYANRHNAGSELLIEALRSPLPGGFCRMGFLDFSNALAFDGRAPAHPFDTDEGFANLLSLLDHHDPGEDSYATSAIAAAPFLSPPRRAELLRRAHAHPHVILHEEARWAEVRMGAPGSMNYLLAAAQKPQTATRAARYLKVLGVAPPPIADTEAFAGMTQVSDWLRNEEDFCGTPPAKLFVVDHRKLRWPPGDVDHDSWIIGFLHTDEGERVSGVVTLCGDTLDRHEDERPRPLEAYAQALANDSALCRLVNARWGDNECWRDLLVRHNPNLS